MNAYPSFPVATTIICQSWHVIFVRETQYDREVMMLIIYVFVILSVLGMIFNAKKNRWGYVLWIISDIIYMLEEPLIGGVLIIVASYGFIEWSKNIEK
jgi:uncharacterized RDD family membrane protein YckC